MKAHTNIEWFWSLCYFTKSNHISDSFPKVKPEDHCENTKNWLRTGRNWVLAHEGIEDGNQMAVVRTSTETFVCCVKMAFKWSSNCSSVNSNKSTVIDIELLTFKSVFNPNDYPFTYIVALYKLIPQSLRTLRMFRISKFYMNIVHNFVARKKFRIQPSIRITQFRRRSEPLPQMCVSHSCQPCR